METVAFPAFVIASLAWIIYGIAFRIFKREPSLAIFWCILALALPGVLGLAGIWQSLRSLLQYAWIAALALVFLYETSFFALASRNFNDVGQPSLDYLVVLGARVLDCGPSTTFARRLETADPSLTLRAVGGEIHAPGDAGKEVRARLTTTTIPTRTPLYSIDPPVPHKGGSRTSPPQSFPVR